MHVPPHPPTPPPAHTHLRSNLAGQRLAGRLSASLAGLPSLALINMSSNALSGGIPPEWSATSALPALATLDLASNALGAMPAALGGPGAGMAALSAVMLQGNQLAGSIPQWGMGGEVTIMPQASASLCGAVPGGGPRLLRATPGGSFPLANSLGSCTVECQNPSVSLAGSNLFDAAAGAGATAWDTAALNNGSASGTNGSALLPCYAKDSGSPAAAAGNPYLGGDMAFFMSAWGAGSGSASAATASPPDATACTGGGFNGSSWFVDLHLSLRLSQVVVVAGAGGVSNVSVSVGDDLSRLSRCAGSLSAAPNASGALACGATGRYLSLSGGSMALCSVQVYPAAANAAPGKAYAYTNGSGVVAGTMWAGSAGLTAQPPAAGGGPALFVLDLGYTGSVSGGALLEPQGVANVSLLASSPMVASASAATGRKLLRALAQAGGGVACAYASNGSGLFSCGGQSGRYLVASGNATLSLAGLTLFEASSPGPQASPAAPASAASVPSAGGTPAAAAGGGGLRSTWAQTLLVGQGVGNEATIGDGTNQVWARGRLDRRGRRAGGGGRLGRRGLERGGSRSAARAPQS